jgi:poly-gamma-glutamate synthesis protein (capsule biosynthesis protein)
LKLPSFRRLLIALAVALEVFLPQGERHARAEPACEAAPSANTLTAPSAPPSGALVVVAGGDVNIGRECGQAILADANYDPFRHVEPIWRDATVRFVNLESQLSDQGGETQSRSNRLIFTGPPGGARMLARAGIHVASTANNHAWDYGRSALFETLTLLEEAGVRAVGTGRDWAKAYEPAVIVSGERSVAIFAITHIWNYGVFAEHDGRFYVAWAKLGPLHAALKRAHREHDLVLLSYHGGAEYIHAPPGPTERFLARVMATGFVDAVIGHHPHVPQGVGWHGDRPIFYSLGNFVFAGHRSMPWTNQSFMARLELTAPHRVRAKACPYRIDGHTPVPLARGSAELSEFQRHLHKISGFVGGTRIGEADALGCLPLEPPSKP